MNSLKINGIIILKEVYIERALISIHDYENLGDCDIGIVVWARREESLCVF